MQGAVARALNVANSTIGITCSIVAPSPPPSPPSPPGPPPPRPPPVTPGRRLRGLQLLGALVGAWPPQSSPSPKEHHSHAHKPAAASSHDDPTDEQHDHSHHSLTTSAVALASAPLRAWSGHAHSLACSVAQWALGRPCPHALSPGHEGDDLLNSGDELLGGRKGLKPRTEGRRRRMQSSTYASYFVTAVVPTAAAAAAAPVTVCAQLGSCLASVTSTAGTLLGTQLLVSPYPFTH